MPGVIFLRHAAHVAEQNRFAVLRRNLAQHARQTLAQEIDRLERGRGFGAEIIGQWQFFPGQAQAIDEEIAGDLEKPGARVVEMAKGRTVKQRFEKDFLQQIVGLGRATRALYQKASQFGLVLPPRRVLTVIGRR
jgi:hypothetical protein